MIDRRALLGAAVASPVLAAAHAPKDHDLLVGPGGVQTLAEGLERARRAARPRYRIALAVGTWAEKLTIDVPGIEITGIGTDSVIVADTAAGTPRPGGGTWGTHGSATLTVIAPDVTLRSLTIRNAFDYLAARGDNHPSIMGAQAVALAIDPAADRTRVIACALESYQDTLYVNARSWFDRCRIAGGVDFIFGGAPAWFDHCEIVTRLVPGAPGQGYVAAPSTPLAQRFGLVFADCRLLREAGVPDASAYLGRPWRAGGNMALTGAATFLRCWMDAHIRPDGWTAMGYRGPDGTQRMLTPQEARLAEYDSTGPGAAPASDTRRHLSAQDAAGYTRNAVLAGWNPARG